MSEPTDPSAPDGSMRSPVPAIAPQAAAPGTKAATETGTAQAAEDTPPPPEHAIGFDGDNDDLWPMTLKIAVLNLLTLFFYRFWGRTQVRQYLWARTSFLGDRLAYTGTGREMFIGFLIVLGVIVLPVGGASLYVAFNWADDLVVQLAFFYGLGAMSYFLFHVASYRALRYRLSRTNWRGIRGSQSGSSLVYGGKVIGWMLLSSMALGLLYPVQSISLTGMKLRNAWFGDRNFSFESAGRSGQLYGPYMRAWLGFIFKPLLILIPFMILAGGIVGISAQSGRQIDETGFMAVLFLGLALAYVGWLRTYARYKAREYAIMAGWARYGDLRFRFEATHNALFRLMFGNLLITLFTLGFGKPFAQKRSVRFIADHLTVVGDPALDCLRQNTDKGPGMGEGLADAFDAGSI